MSSSTADEAPRRVLTDADLALGAGPRAEVSDLSCLFFSRQNFEALHRGIRNLVWRASREHIGRQDDLELFTVMRQTFVQDAEHLPGRGERLLAQVRALNERVLARSVPQIVSSIGLYREYLRRMDAPPVPLDHARPSRVL